VAIGDEAIRSENVRNHLYHLSWFCALASLGAAVGCGSSSSATGGAAGGPSMEELTAKLQSKQAAATSTPATATNPSAGDAGGEPARVSNGDGPIAKEASDRGPLQSRPGTYAHALASSNRNMRTMLDDVAWQKSVQLFEAEKGYKPRTTQEFMERVRSEGTPLPIIEPGTMYYYVPNEGQFGQLYQVPLGSDVPGVPPPGR
jgi:hypothetical protein